MSIRERSRSGAVTRVTVALAATAILAATAAAGGRWGVGGSGNRSAEDFDWQGHIAAGKAIEIKGVNGGIVAEATTGSDVEVHATRRAHRSDPEEVHIEVIQHKDGVTICAVYPTPPGQPPNDCVPGPGGHSSTQNNDVEVQYTVRVPAGVRFIGRTVNGGIEANRLRADAEGYTVNGSVKISTRGVARASTVNGSIDAVMGTAMREPLEFETVNGGISLVVPAGCDAMLRASTTNGDIESDFPITVRGRINHRRVSGTIGRGGPQLMMTTVNGDIRLRSSAS